MHARIGWQNLRTSEFLDSGDYMLITGTDFIDGAVNFDTCHYVERERYEQDKHIQIRNGSILITKDGTLGKVAYIQGLTMPATLNAGVFNVEIKDENEVDNRYLFQYLKAPFLMDYVDKKATGGTIKHLNQNILVDFPVVLPHKAEQEKIGEYFLAIDHLITLHQCKCQIDGCRFQSPLAITWEQRKVTEIGKIYIGLVTTMTKHYTDEGTLLIRNSDIKDGKFEFGDNPIYLEKTFAEKNETRMHQIGDVITVHTGDVGTSAVITENEAKSIGFATIVTRPNPKIIDSNYLCSFLNTDKHKKWAVSISTGDGRTNYNLGDYFELVVPVPSIAEQKKIASYIQKLNRLITLHQREFAFLCKEKSKKFRYIKNAWEQRKFSDLVQIERGGSPRPIDDFITDSPDGLNWVKIGDAPAQGNYITKTAEKIKPEGLSKTREVHPGDLILSNSMSFGKPYIMGIDGCIHDGWLLIRNTYKAFDLTFLCHLLGTPQMIIQYKSLAAGSTVNNLNKELVGNTVVTIPTIKEQRVLGQYLETLDNLITLHQRKYDKLTNVKKSMLEKMFPQNGSNAPEIRFKGFTEAWEQRKFGEVFDCTVPNNTLSRAELSYDEGTVLNVHYGDVLIKYGSVLDVQKDDIPRIPHRCREDFNGALLQDGDVIIADTAEDETTGKACEIGNLQGSAIVSGLHTMVCRPRNRMALGYLGYYLNSNAYHYQLLPLMQGIKVLSLSRSNIQKTSVSYPSAMKEQQLIASYFSQLDHLITLHQRELEKLKNLKKACLEKMFV